MKTVIFQSESKSDIKTLSVLAKKLRIKGKFISEEELEDMGLLSAIKKRSN